MGARHRDCDGGFGSSKRRLAAKAVIAACVRKAGHLEMREVVAAWRKGAGCVPSFGSGKAGALH